MLFRSDSANPGVPSPSSSSRQMKISGPKNGAPIPAGFKFGSKESEQQVVGNDRERKAKSRNFWRWPTGSKFTISSWQAQLLICCTQAKRHKLCQ